MSCICKPDVKIVKPTVAVRNGEFVKHMRVKSPRIESHPTVFFPSATVASYRPTFLIHDNSVSNKSAKPSHQDGTAHPTAAAHSTNVGPSHRPVTAHPTAAAHSTNVGPSHRPVTAHPTAAAHSTTVVPSHRTSSAHPTAAAHRVQGAHPTAAAHSTTVAHHAHPTAAAHSTTAVPSHRPGTAHPTVTHGATHPATRVITQSSNLSRKTSRELLEKVVKMQQTLNRSKSHPYESKSHIDEFKEKKKQVKELKLVGPTNAPRTRSDAVIQGRREWENPKNREQLSKIFDSREEYVQFKINNYLDEVSEGDSEDETDSDWSDDD